MATVQHPRLRDAPLDFKGGAGSFCKKKNLTHSKVKKNWPTHRRKKKTWPTWEEEKKKTCPARVKKKNYPHIEEGEKVHTWDLSYSEGRGRSLSKGGYLFDLWQWHSHPKCSLQVDALNFKHCMEHVESL